MNTKRDYVRDAKGRFSAKPAAKPQSPMTDDEFELESQSLAEDVKQLGRARTKADRNHWIKRIKASLDYYEQRGEDDLADAAAMALSGVGAYKIKKNADTRMISAFGVDHGTEIAKADRRTEAGGAAVGAVAGQGLYQASGYGPKHIGLRMERRMTRAARNKRLKPAKKAHGEFTPAMERNYPKTIPGWQFHRALGWTHRGKVGTAIGAGATAAGGAAGVHATRKKKVSKSLGEAEMAAALSKAADRKKRKEASGSAIAGAGAVTAGAGAVGGGAPGFRSDSETIRNVRQGGFKQRTGAALSSGRGGVFGYRTDAHQGALDRFRADEKKYAGKPATRSEMFLRGRGTGKIKPEVDIIRHLKGARRASHVALAGGSAATAYGVQRARDQKKVSKARKDTERYHGAMLGAGGTAAATSIGGEKILRRQGRKWADREAASRTSAAKIVPNLKPTVSDSEAVRNKKILAGKSKAQAEAAGSLRGAAAQQRYFSAVYEHSAKTARKIRNPALATAAVGAGGLMLAGKKEKR